MMGIKYIYRWMAVASIGFFVSGCSDDESTGVTVPDTVPVAFRVELESGITRAPGDAALSVTRILLLPFRKASESVADDDSNFVPDYNLAKQIDAPSFPSVATMLNLQAGTTYRIMVIGYNRNDYDYANPSGGLFSIASAGSPATLANLYLSPVNPANVPEFFTCMGAGYNQTALVGNSFKPEQVTYIQGTLKRIVSGLTIRITGIPAYVTSVSLTAEQLVTATRATDGTALAWQTPGDGSAKTFGSRTPASGQVNFNYCLLAVPDSRKTLFYLDVSYGGTFTERYTVKVADQAGVASGNRITFAPNHWVQVTGDYSKINIGFTITDTVNLDDNTWDGIS